MNKQKQKLIDRMNDLQTLIPDTVKAIDDLPDIGHLYTWLNPGELQIRLDYKFNEYMSYRRMIAKKWKYTNHNFNNLTGNYYVKFKHRELSNIELSLELEFSTDYEDGASCRLVEVGHKTQIIYGLEYK